ncbi:pentapeptide repeat-containing protein [Nocardia sp. SSK8]|uniref:pentapeptide repeat-containing protein n=1 Tax=Nocardia sp. SSK8 TaxID=3120154 RepID=UPI00300B6D85
MRVRPTLTALGIAAGVVLLILAIYRLPLMLAPESLRELTPKERLDAAVAQRGQFAALIGTLIALAGLFYTVRKFLLDRAKQDVDRFSAVVGHLADDDPVTRSGGVFALQRLMEDAPRERERGLRLLARLLQRRTANGEFGTGPGDLVDAVAVLRGRLAGKHSVTGLDLSGARLPGADLRGVRLPGARLARTDLSAADLRGADLRDADLSEATFTGADLRAADLRGAVLRRTRLDTARLSGADLADADLTGTVLTGTDLTGAQLHGVDTTTALGLPTDAALPAPSP